MSLNGAGALGEGTLVEDTEGQRHVCSKLQDGQDWCEISKCMPLFPWLQVSSMHSQQLLTIHLPLYLLGIQPVVDIANVLPKALEGHGLLLHADCALCKQGDPKTRVHDCYLWLMSL